jgi:hypothetical protein
MGPVGDGLIAEDYRKSGGPNGIRELVGQDLPFEIRGVAIRHQRTRPQRDSNPCFQSATRFHNGR